MGNGAGAKVHAGFLEASSKLFVQLDPILKNLMESNHDYRLYFTGHSKGGGVATLSAVFTAQSHPNWRPSLITFAPPRVGNREFRRLFDKFFASTTTTTTSTTTGTAERTSDVTAAAAATTTTTTSFALGYFHRQDPVLYFNQDLWNSLKYEVVGTEVECVPDAHQISKIQSSSSYWSSSSSSSSSPTTPFDYKILVPPLNIFQHLRYVRT